MTKYTDDVVAPLEDVRQEVREAMGVDRPSDPAEKGVDQFKNHRAGYQNFDLIMRIARKGGTLSAGEGGQIIAHYEDKIAELNKRIEMLEGLLRSK